MFVKMDLPETVELVLILTNVLRMESSLAPFQQMEDFASMNLELSNVAAWTVSPAMVLPVPTLRNVRVQTLCVDQILYVPTLTVASSVLAFLATLVKENSWKRDAPTLMNVWPLLPLAMIMPCAPTWTVALHAPVMPDMKAMV